MMVAQSAPATPLARTTPILYEFASQRCGSDGIGSTYFTSTTSLPTRYSIHKLTSLNGTRMGVKLTLVDTVSGQTTQAEAEIVVSAVGAFTSPLFPKNVTGAENFRGPLWHSFHWRHDVDLKNKRVGVIGNGCSVYGALPRWLRPFLTCAHGVACRAQFLPIISEERTTEVINLCRSPQWFVERGQYRYPEWIKSAFAQVPFLMRAYRASIMIRSDLAWFIYKNNLPFGKFLRTVIVTFGFISTSLLTTAQSMVRYLKDTAPVENVDRMIPDYRLSWTHPGYLAALHRPNVQLKWDTVQEIVEDGVVSRDVSFRGLNGLALDEYFESEGGAAGYYGTVFLGFLNAFTIVGPNSGSGHASILFTIELQIDYILKLIKPIIAGKFKALKVREEATKRYNAWIGKRMENTIFLSCFSYYRGDDRKGTRNITTFPGMLTLYWWKLRWPRWADYEVLQEGGWVGVGGGEEKGLFRRWILGERR
ncbi:hypothetical protein J3R83DRAFT_4842 [Lanmaoa asiatica]|nr:hypothetical protein J3R83DRAFT_4842 [Lanmaoa asiatica]